MISTIRGAKRRRKCACLCKKSKASVFISLTTGVSHARRGTSLTTISLVVERETTYSSMSKQLKKPSASVRSRMHTSTTRKSRDTRTFPTHSMQLQRYPTLMSPSLTRKSRSSTKRALVESPSFASQQSRSPSRLWCLSRLIPRLRNQR